MWLPESHKAPFPLAVICSSYASHYYYLNNDNIYWHMQNMLLNTCLLRFAKRRALRLGLFRNAAPRQLTSSGPRQQPVKSSFANRQSASRREVNSEWKPLVWLPSCLHSGWRWLSNPFIFETKLPDFYKIKSRMSVSSSDQSNIPGYLRPSRISQVLTFRLLWNTIGSPSSFVFKKRLLKILSCSAVSPPGLRYVPDDLFLVSSFPLMPALCWAAV